MSESFTEINTEDANTFLAVLEQLSSSGIMPGAIVSSTIFRGVSDGKLHKLIPSACRPHDFAFLVDLNKFETKESWVDLEKTPNGVSRSFHELMGLATFYKLANEQSLSMPRIPADLHSVLVNRINSASADIIFNWHKRQELWTILALAQHYKFPTRLLDWSKDFNVSAYFAASGGAKKVIEKDSCSDEIISVWVTYPHVINYTYQSNSNVYIYVVDAPYLDNPNLAAQKGRFTLVVDRSTENNDEETYKQPLDVVFSQLYNNTDDKLKNLYQIKKASDAFIRVSLPLSNSFELLNLLYRKGYTATKIYPGHVSSINHAVEALSIIKYIE